MIQSLARLLAVRTMRETILYELWQKMGDDMFFQMLHKYYETYRFKLATTQDFLTIVRSFRNDAAINEIIHRYISKD